MERVYLKELNKIEAIKSYLKEYDLKLDQNIEELYIVKEMDEIIATGAISGSILKCITVKAGYNLINTVMSFLINRAYTLGRQSLYIYTKPESYQSFQYLGFKSIAKTANVVLMENDPLGIENYKTRIGKTYKEGLIGSVVVNCNPFTKGHQHLIEYAANHCDHLHVFVVWEDASTFPNDIRYELIEKGIDHIKNVSLHKGEAYIISNATFPSYFLKDDADLTKEQAALDLHLFGLHIAKTLNIQKRFVGQEPFNSTTRKYNETMKEVLKTYDIEVIEIPRIKNKDLEISASNVRALIYEDHLEALKELVPQSTYEFIHSPRGQILVTQIKKSYRKERLV